MDQTTYTSGEFARKAAVSVRTLRFYDRKGLLSPSRYTEAGYRLYSDADLLDLQQILALKFLGFTLEQIKALRQVGPRTLEQTLARQKAMMQDRRAQLDSVIQAIEQTEALVKEKRCNWEAIGNIIEVIQMEKKKDWVSKYFSPEEQATMKRLQDEAYSDEAKIKMAAWPEWTEEDQKRVDAEYAALAADLKRLVAEGKDPASQEAQSAAKRQLELIARFTRNDPEIEKGLGEYWQKFDALPEQDRPPALPWGEEEGSFLQKAIAIYQQNA